MSDVKPKQRVLSLPVRKLLSHPANPNRMSNAAFNKLARHIERTGQYEPIVVRTHPHKQDAWQILNGHHRMRVLKRLDYRYADCVVFEADDTQALVYLATLNQLKGRSNLRNKSKLIAALCKYCSSQQLGQILPESKTAIDKLAALASHQPPATSKTPHSILKPMTFFVTDTQQQLISKAFEKAVESGETGTRTEKRLRALCRIVENYLGNDTIGCSEASAGKKRSFPEG